MSAPRRASLAEPKPSSLHTTLAAVRSHRRSHTVPHLPSRSTSTRPSPNRGPAFRRTAACGNTRQREPCVTGSGAHTWTSPQTHVQRGRSLRVSGGGDSGELNARNAAHHRVHSSGAGDVVPGDGKLRPTMCQRNLRARTLNPLDPERLLTDRRPADTHTSLYESTHTASTENKQQMKPYLVAGSSILESHSFLKRHT